MKISAILLCVAASSLVACADVETNGGGQGEGLMPAKFGAPSISSEDLPSLTSHNLILRGREGAETVCEDCEMTNYDVVNDPRFDQIRIVTDHDGRRICGIAILGGGVVYDECGWRN